MVAWDRNIPKENLRKIADGRIFTGRQAQKLGLVDYLGDMGYAVTLAGEISGIKGKPEVIYPKKKGSRFWDYFFREILQPLSFRCGEKQSNSMAFCISRPLQITIKALFYDEKRAG